MKLKMKLELRTLKKIADEVVHEDDSYVVVVPANVYENPLDTIPTPSFDGINGCYGSATEEQLKLFYGDSMPYKPVIGVKGLKTEIFSLFDGVINLLTFLSKSLTHQHAWKRSLRTKSRR